MTKEREAEIRTAYHIYRDCTDQTCSDVVDLLAEIDCLRADIDSYLAIATEHINENERLRAALTVISMEKNGRSWAASHARKALEQK